MAELLHRLLFCLLLVQSTIAINEKQSKIDKNRPPLAASTKIFLNKQNQNSVKMLKKISNQHFLHTSKSCDIGLTEAGKFLFDVLRYSCNEIKRMQMMAMLATKKELQNNPVKNNKWEDDQKGETRKFFCTPNYCYRIQENGKNFFYTCNHTFCAPIKKEHLRQIKIAKTDIARLIHHSPQAVKQPE